MRVAGRNLGAAGHAVGHLIRRNAGLVSAGPLGQEGFPRSAGCGRVEARKRLRDAAAAFQSWMLSAGIEGAAWREQVLRDGFERRISSGEDLTPEELQTFADRLAPDVATREVWAIGDLRRAAERLALVLRDRSDDALKRKFEARLDALSAAMESHAHRPDPSRLRQIADDLTWLDRRGQVPSVTAAVRAHFSHANFEARLSKRFIETVSLENVDQTEPIHDVLDGSEVRGRSRTVGRSFASPVADDGRLVLEFRLALSIHSRTFGCGGPLQGLVDATSHVTSTTQVVWDGRGFSSLPASARAEATVWSADVEDRQALGARRAQRRMRPAGPTARGQGVAGGAASRAGRRPSIRPRRGGQG